MLTLGYDKPLYLMAFDHRSSFSKGLFGVRGPLTPEVSARIDDTKELIFEAFLEALVHGAPRQHCGVLVDEEFGAAVAKRAKAGGFLLAMPVEKSGQRELQFEYGDQFAQHIEAFDPDFSKVLVRYNPENDNRVQTERLAQLSEWLHANERKFLFELLVPPTAEQHARYGERYDHELRATLVVEALRELQDSGVEPDIWKIEGLESTHDCMRVVEQARSGGRDGVVCIVLGRGANLRRVVSWLATAASVPGFVGFAVGRTEWQDALEGYVAGERSREETRNEIADHYVRLIHAWVEHSGTGIAAPLY